MSDAAHVEREMQSTTAEAILAETLARVATVEQELHEYKKLYALLREENERLKRGLNGQNAERLPQNDAQLSLAILALMMSDANEPPPASPEEQHVEAHTRQKPKRKLPPADWPRIYIELVPPEVEREGLDAFTIIGSETRAVIERRPASCVVVEVVRKKFARKADKEVSARKFSLPSRSRSRSRRALRVRVCWPRRSSAAGAITNRCIDKRASTHATVSRSPARRCADGTRPWPLWPCRWSGQ